VSGTHLGPATNFSSSLKFSLDLRVCSLVAPSLTKGRVCNLLMMLILLGAVPLGSESHRNQYHILLSQILRLPKPGGPDPRIYIPQEQGSPDIPLALGSLSVASYDSQAYGCAVTDTVWVAVACL
jgi:hypothetical protein